MAHSEWERLFAPAAVDRVHVTGAHAAALNLDIDVEVAKRTHRELAQLKMSPSLGRVHLEALELLWYRHGGLKGRMEGGYHWGVLLGEGASALTSGGS